MMFSTLVVRALNNPLNQDQTWSQIFKNWTLNDEHWKSLAFSSGPSSTITNSIDLKKFFDDHKEFGLLVIDHRDRPRLIHSIKHLSDNNFLGITSNTFLADPIEIELRPNSFLNINPIPTSDSNTPNNTSTTTTETEPDTTNINTNDQNTINPTNLANAPTPFQIT
jgi:hypothetical protein